MHTPTHTHTHTDTRKKKTPLFIYNNNKIEAVNKNK